MLPIIQEDGSVRVVSIREAQSITTSQMPELTVKGAYTWLRRGFEGFRTTFQNFYSTDTGFRDMVVTYYQMGGMSVLPLQDEGMPAGAMGFGDIQLLSFRPVKRTGMMSITEEMMMFDKTTELKDKSTKFGVAQRRTLEVMAWDLVRTPPGSVTPDLGVPSVYQTASTVARPWINSGSQLWGGSALYDTLQYMVNQTDPNGNIHGVNPDSMLVPFNALAPVKQVLESDWLGFTGNSTQGGLTGVPTANIYKGMISSDNIYTSPFWKPFSGTPFNAQQYPWVIFDKGSDLTWKFLEVEPLSILNENMDQTSDGWFTRGEVRIRARLWTVPTIQHPQYIYGQFPVS